MFISSSTGRDLHTWELRSQDKAVPNSESGAGTALFCASPRYSGTGQLVKLSPSGKNALQTSQLGG